MLLPILIGFILVCIIGFFVAAVMSQSSSSGGNNSNSSMHGNMRKIVASQRQSERPEQVRQAKNVFETLNNAQKMKKAASSKMTVAKKLKYGTWKMSVGMFRGIEISISLAFTAMLTGVVSPMVQLLGLTLGPIIMNALVDRAIKKRFAAFDRDYPNFLLSLIGLLKTGMNAMQAIEAAAAGLEPNALLRIEVEMMMERLRVGVPEDMSIGSFGEDIAHPEIELFVQALLLSRRVGGTLSDTLARLAIQVRKRQYFRSQAVAAVGMQRGSIWFILGIMVALETYLMYIMPEAVFGAMRDPTGWMVWQGGLCSILTGMYWVRKVTNIKV